MNQKDHLFATQTLLNSIPIDDFMGLTPAEMHTLLYDPFSEGSAVTIKSEIPDDVLNQIPIFRLAETLVAIMRREGFVKLTPLGLLNKKTLHELYDYKFYPNPLVEEGRLKLSREVYWHIMSSCRDTLQLGGFIRKSKGKLFLTAKANKLLDQGNRSEFFRHFLLAFTRKFNWSIYDGYEEMLMIQQNVAFPVYLLHKCGSVFRYCRFYTDNIIKAYPNIPEIYRIIDGVEDINLYHDCFQTRFFERFTQWFGFTEAIGSRYNLTNEPRQFKTTTVFDEVFQFD